MLEGGERNQQAKYPDQEYVYYFCAKEFGWTITQTDEQPAHLVDWVLGIANMIGEMNEVKE